MLRARLYGLIESTIMRFRFDNLTRFVIVIVVLTSWASINYGVFFGKVSIATHLEPLAQRALGLLDAATMLVLNYFLSSSASSAQKTEMLAKAQPIQEETHQ